MTPPPESSEPPKGLSRRRLLQAGAGGVLAGSLGGLVRRADPALAEDFCIHPNPIVRENRCTTTWTDEFQLSNFDGLVLGFALQTSYNVGEAVKLKLVSYDGAATSARLRVYRLGHYGGFGGRLVHELTGVALPSGGAQGAPSEQTQYGLVSCASFPVVTDLGFSPSVSGVYLVKIVANTGAQNHVVFVVRDDGRPRDLLVVMPTNSWQAYNNWGGKSVYFYNSSGPSDGGGTTVAGVNSGHSRAVKVSFDRPHSNANSDFNWVLHTEFPLIAWLERQGYDLAYTDDHGLDSQPDQLSPANTKTIVIAGHSEYWTKGMRDNVQAARDAGTNIASFSANTAYWQVRYEDSGRTMVCFKTVEGTITSGTAGVNDYGPGANARNGPNDPLGPDQLADTADDKPQFATTTFRDRGLGQEPATTGRVAIHRPENALFGVLFIGDDDTYSRGLGIPAGSGAGGEFGDHPAWRHTDVGTGGATIGSDLVGWEWDAVPPNSTPYQEAFAAQPGGVKRLAETTLAYNPAPVGSAIEFLQDDGRVYTGTPPAGLSALAHAITYRAGSGALVFASGTMQWSWGLAPHYLPLYTDTYEVPPADSSDPRIQQATYNILADGGAAPDTPEGIVLDSGATAPEGTPPTAAPPPTGPPGPPVDRTGPFLTISTRVPNVGSAGIARVRVSCPAAEVRGAEGTLMLTSASAIASGAAKKKRKSRLKLGSKGFQVLGGKSIVVEVRLSKRALSALRRAGAMKVAATIVARDAAGNAATSKRRITLHAAGARKPAAKR